MEEAERVEPIKLEKDMRVDELVTQMGKAGFGARKIGKAAEITRKMFDDTECKIFMGIAGAMVPAGMKQIFIDLIRGEKVNILVTTGANLTHDLVEVLGGDHYHCDRWDDEEFNEKGHYRMHNVFMRNSVYESIESFFEKNWKEFEGTDNIKEFLWKIGELLPSEPKSLLRTCYEKKIPVFCPSLADSGIGLMIWGRLVNGKQLNVSAFGDMNELIDFAWTAKKTGVIYIGGGMPKNFIQQSLQFSKGADYGVQITTDRVENGGSSGAPLREGKSWGKLRKGRKEDIDFIDVYCDATIALPLIFAETFASEKNN